MRPVGKGRQTIGKRKAFRSRGTIHTAGLSEVTAHSNSSIPAQSRGYDLCFPVSVRKQMPVATWSLSK